MARHDWDFMSDSVQAYWDQLENQLVTIVDELVPLVTQTNIEAPLPAFMNQKLNHRKRLLKSNKRENTARKTERIKTLNSEIKRYFHNQKASKVRRSIYPGNTGSLWKAVKTAKDVNTKDLPSTMYENNVPIIAHSPVFH